MGHDQGDSVDGDIPGDNNLVSHGVMDGEVGSSACWVSEAVGKHAVEERKTTDDAQRKDHCLVSWHDVRVCLQKRLLIQLPQKTKISDWRAGKDRGNMGESQDLSLRLAKSLEPHAVDRVCNPTGRAYQGRFGTPSSWVCFWADQDMGSF